MGGGHLSYTTEIDFFAKRGYLVLAYDQTGTMASDGKALRGMGQGFRDLLCAMQFAKENEKSKICLFCSPGIRGAATRFAARCIFTRRCAGYWHFPRPKANPICF